MNKQKNKDQEYFDSKIDKIKKAYNSLPKIIRIFIGISVYAFFLFWFFGLIFEDIKNKDWFKLSSVLAAGIIVNFYYGVIKKD